MAKQKIANTRTPLDSRYFRRPGQSLDELIGKLHERVLMLVMIAVMLFLVAWMEWINYFAKITLLVPMFFTLVFLIGLAYSLITVSRIAKQVKSIKLGRDGEREVAHYLEELMRTTGCYVFHDVRCKSGRGQSFNIDHVIVSTCGVFVVETKARSKPAKGGNIAFDGERVTLTGHPSDSEPIRQARMNAQWLRNRIRNDGGIQLDVTAIVVFPGWWVAKEQMRIGKDVSVMPSKYLPYAFQGLTPILLPGEMKTLADIIRPLTEAQRNLV